jgi:hypothetical protein
VKYEITATIKKNRSQQKMVSREITVPSTKDVQDLELRRAFKGQKKVMTGSLIWKSGYFNVKFSVPKSGYNSVIAYDRQAKPFVPIKPSNQSLLEHASFFKKGKFLKSDSVPAN